jgi:membrane-associated phospholipid phosphatase
VTRARGWTNRALPRVADALLQLGLWIGAYYAYRLVRGFMDGQTAVAFDHARGIVNFERNVGMFFEPGLQHWVSNHMGWLIDVSSWCYVNLHLIGTSVFMLWLYFARREAFPFVRNMFMIAMGLALVGYMVFPTAPPRYLPEWGFTDTVSNFVGTHAANTASVLYNPYAAIPSMHVAFALMAGFTGAALTRKRWLRPLWYFYPVLVSIVVVVTANHFWIDAALGAIVAALAFYAASYALARARPHVWAWRTPAGEVEAAA